MLTDFAHDAELWVLKVHCTRGQGLCCWLCLHRIGLDGASLCWPDAHIKSRHVAMTLQESDSNRGENLFIIHGGVAGVQQVGPFRPAIELQWPHARWIWNALRTSPESPLTTQPRPSVPAPRWRQSFRPSAAAGCCSSMSKICSCWVRAPSPCNLMACFLPPGSHAVYHKMEGHMGRRDIVGHTRRSGAPPSPSTQAAVVSICFQLTAASLLHLSHAQTAGSATCGCTQLLSATRKWRCIATPWCCQLLCRSPPTGVCTTLCCALSFGMMGSCVSSWL